MSNFLSEREREKEERNFLREDPQMKTPTFKIKIINDYH